MEYCTLVWNVNIDFHLLVRSYKTLGSSYSTKKNPLDINPFGITCMQVKSHLRNLLVLHEPSFYKDEGLQGY
jgi:hypothetical protein